MEDEGQAGHKIRVEGEVCVLVEEEGEGIQEGESPSPGLRSGGWLVWGAGMCRRWGMGLSLGPSVGLVAPGTEDRVISPGFTEEPCSQCAEQGDLWESMCVAFVDKKLINCQSKKETENLFKPT